MADRPMKHIRDSRTEHVQIIMPEHINGRNRLFGGQLMEWIDIVAGVVARRHANADITTASVDQLVFKSAAYVGSTILLVGVITFVGRTSMEVRVDSYVEELSGERNAINRAYLTMVALGEGDRPKEVPGLILDTDEERAEWAAGERRREARKQAERP